MTERKLRDRIAVVTGANSGIGLATAKGLADLGATVIMACRSAERAKQASQAIAAQVPEASLEFLELDLSDPTSIRAFTASFEERHERLDILVNNAGIMEWGHKLSPQGWEVQFGTNHLGHFLLTTRLKARLAAAGAARVVTVSSVAHYRGRLDLGPDFSPAGLPGGFQGYSNSKLANVLFTRELARRWANLGITANCLHPGVIATNIFGVPGPLKPLAALFLTPPEKGAHTSLLLAASPEVEDVSGQYFDAGRQKQPSSQALDDDSARRLWEISESLVN